jgi:hypothetical protein
VTKTGKGPAFSELHLPLCYTKRLKVQIQNPERKKILNKEKTKGNTQYHYRLGNDCEISSKLLRNKIFNQDNSEIKCKQQSTHVPT